MRCPKCHYLSFEPESRCRNCGYDFALAESPMDDEELSIKPAEASEAPLADLDLRDRTPGPRPVAPITLALDMEWQPAERRAGSAAAVAVAVAEPPAVTAPAVAPVAASAPAPAAALAAVPAPAPRVVPPRAPTTTTELPLFVRGLPPPALPNENAAFDVPAALAAHTSRPPLAVRRRAPEPVPMSSQSMAAPSTTRPGSPFSGLASAKSGGAEHGRLLEIPQGDAVWAPLPAADRQAASEARAAASNDQVSVGQRVLAALVDASLLGAIDAGIVWFTLRICALTIGQAAALPLLPLATFCVILDIGYLLMFTATSGQTVGKMAAGIRVVGVSADSTNGGYLTVRQAALRALLTLPSVLTAGAGFLPAVLGRGRAVHDRLAHTRVVRS